MEQFPSAAAQGQAQRPAILNPMDVVQQRQAIQLQKQSLAKGQQDVLQSKQQTQNEASAHAVQVQAADDDAATRQALQSNNGDEEKAASVLRRSGYGKAADTLDANRATRAKSDAATMTETLKNASTKLELTAQLLQGVDSEEKFQMTRQALTPILGPEGIAKLGTNYSPETVKSAIAMGTKQADFMKAKQDAITHSDKLLEQGVPQRDEQGNLKLTPKAEKEWTEGAAKMFTTAQSPEDFAQDVAVLKHLQYPQEILDKFGQFDASFPERVQSMLVTPKDASNAEGGFQDFYKQYLKDNALPRRADNELKARQLFEASNRAPKEAPTPSVDQQSLTAFLAKNPSKTAQDYEAWKATLAPQAGALASAPGKADTQDRTLKNEVLKIYAPAQDSAERLNVMTENYKDAVEKHDQQAMLSLLANHLGMTMGLQKGARITQAVMNEAVASRPWLQGVQAKFDKDGYLSGVNLTPTQMEQMVKLGQGRFSQDIQKSKSSAKYIGAVDDGPERVPSRSTMEYYLRASGGDVGKAKAAASADGWTIK